MPTVTPSRTQLIGWHGSPEPVSLSGRYWLALDREYAEGYAGEDGHVYEVTVPARLLDLRDLGIDCTSDDLREALTDAGVAVPSYLGWDGSDDDPQPADEMHQRVPRIEAAARAAGYEAIAIREWTDMVGETDSVLLLG